MSSQEIQQTKGTEPQVLTSQQVPPVEEAAGQFRATARPPFALSLLLGALAGLLSRSYLITVTDQKLHFTKISIWTNKPEFTDVFTYDEIEKATLKTGKLLSSIKLKFKNGNTLKLQAPYRSQKPANNQAAFLDEALAQYLKDRLPCIPY